MKLRLDENLSRRLVPFLQNEFPGSIQNQIDELDPGLRRGDEYGNRAAMNFSQPLISAFSQHLVKTGHIPVELGKAINATEDMRVAADYKSEPINLDSAAWAVAESHRFAAAIRRLVLHTDET